MEAAVVAKDLTRVFGDFVAVDHVSFSVAPGEIFGFLGPNGAGKSTTIRMLNGILMPTSGQATVLGYDIYTEVDRIKENIGYMSQKFSLYDDLKVIENIEFYGGIYNVPEQKRRQRYEWALKMAGLADKREAITGDLAVGWKQRLALGCALLHEPRLLFLDEPTSGVDPKSRRDFWDLIGEIADRGTTVFVTTHYMDEAEHCDRLGLIYRAKLITIGTPEQLKFGSMPGKVLEVTASDVVAASKVAEGVDGVLEAAIFGTQLHVVVRDVTKGKKALSAALTQRGIQVAAIEEIEPSLEDVFVSLIRSHDLADENGARDAASAG
jgi:ABC-2 type transport system ATP-binding protein